jgi:hypothetical protein
MFYSILLLLSGIYIGQEYHTLPSVRLISITILNYLNNLKNNNENNNENNNYYNQLFSYFLKSNKDQE